MRPLHSPLSTCRAVGPARGIIFLMFWDGKKCVGFAGHAVVSAEGQCNIASHGGCITRQHIWQGKGCLISHASVPETCHQAQKTTSATDSGKLVPAWLFGYWRAAIWPWSEILHVLRLDRNRRGLYRLIRRGVESMKSLVRCAVG